VVDAALHDNIRYYSKSRKGEKEHGEHKGSIAFSSARYMRLILDWRFFVNNRGGRKKSRETDDKRIAEIPCEDCAG
jgi:hypothetical protein